MVAHAFNPSVWDSHTFNPGIRWVESGRNRAGQRKLYKAGGDRTSNAFRAYRRRFGGDTVQPRKSADHPVWFGLG